MSIYNLLVGVFWLAFYLYWMITSVGAKKNIRQTHRGRDAGIRFLLLILIILALHIPVFRNFFTASLIRHVSPVSPEVDILGLLLVLAGLSLAVWARIIIGRNWGMPMTVKKEPELVNSGPYAYIRHPIYSGMIFAGIGTVLVEGRIWLIPFTVMTIYFIYSALTEEKNLTRLFPQKYPEYMHKTRRLIPYIR